MSYLDDLKRKKLELVSELADFRPEQQLLSEIWYAVGQKKSNGIVMQNPSTTFSLKSSYTSHINSVAEPMRSELSERASLKSKIYQIEQEISNEQARIEKSKDDAHKKRRELMSDRHKQLMALLDKMDRKRLDSGANALQVEQERTKRAQINRQIQSLINENDDQDRIELDGLFDELRTMATQGLS